MLPRVMATVRFISWGVIPLGALATGAAAAALGNRDALWLLVSCSLLTPLTLHVGPIRGRVNLER
jgi:hypothetical protein